MWAALKAFAVTNAVRLAGIVLAAFSILSVLLAARQAGKADERNAALTRQAENVREAHEIENQNRKLPDGIAAHKLRSKWSRDE